MSEDFQKSVTSRKGFTIGVKPPMDQKIESWIQETSNAPAPMSLRLNSILDLFDGSHGIEVTKAVKENMQRALEDYCTLLKKQGEVLTCEAPGPDPLKPGCAKEDNIDYNGNDIKNKQVGSLGECINWCGETPECRYWSFGKSDRRCYLKTSNTGRRENSGTISGTKNCATVSFPDPKKYYNIENTRYSGTRIHGNLGWGPGCTTGWHGADDQMWRFEPKGSSYYIYNKHNYNYRLVSASWAKENFGLYDGGFYPDQEWKLTFVGGNKVRINNVANGYKLGQWKGGESGECGTGNWAQADDQIWELKEV